MRIGALMALLFLIPSLVLAVDVDKFTGVTLLPPQNPPIVAKLSPMSVYWLDFSELGVDTDGDGFKEAIVEVSVPSMPKDRWMDIFLSTHYGRGKISATLITPTPINFEKKEWDYNIIFRIPNVLSGTYRVIVEEKEKNSLVRIVVPIYEIRDNLIIPISGIGTTAKWNGMDIIPAFDEKGFSPAIWEISPQVITVNPGEEFDLRINFTIRQLTYHPPDIIWQVFLLYSWSPTWPPTEDYYVTLYDSTPFYDGENIIETIKVKAPETPGEYYIWIAMCMHYSVDLAIEQITSKPPLPAHVKVIVRSAPPKPPPTTPPTPPTPPTTSAKIFIEPNKTTVAPNGIFAVDISVQDGTAQSVLVNFTFDTSKISYVTGSTRGLFNTIDIISSSANYVKYLGVSTSQVNIASKTKVATAVFKVNSGASGTISFSVVSASVNEANATTSVGSLTITIPPTPPTTPLTTTPSPTTPPSPKVSPEYTLTAADIFDIIFNIFVAAATFIFFFLFFVLSPLKERAKKSPDSATKKPMEKPMKKLEDFPLPLTEKYEPLKFLSEGGFARVFKAKRKSDGKIVAIKIPRLDEKTSSIFLREIASWYHLNHPNIVRLYSADILPVPYMEMEYVEGVKISGKTVRDLERYPKPVNEDIALSIVKGIADGLKHAHDKGIYHLDLKPLNVLIKSDLMPKITDWGLAKISARSSSTANIGYSPLYAAPEQIDEKEFGQPDHRTDIYGLGVILYELLTGKLPYEAMTPSAVLGKIVAENIKPDPVSKHNPALAKFDGLIEKLLAKRKEDRFQSVDEVLSALDSMKSYKKELEELKKSLEDTKTSLRKSRSKEEMDKLQKEAVEKTAKIALLAARLNDKPEVLNALEELKLFTKDNLEDLLGAVSSVELMIKEGIPIGDEFIERLRVLLSRIKREFKVGE
ncbi:MAG: protein kinase [Archaeoglobaceae archaeon]